MVVESAQDSAICPGCGAEVAPSAVISETEVEEEVAGADQAPDSAQEPEPVSDAEQADDDERPDGDEWNLGEPMHRVFVLSLLAPQKIALATVFRSLRWVFLFAWVNQVILQGSGLLISAAIVRQGAADLAATESLADATGFIAGLGPEARRAREAAQQLCALTMISPAQRLHCAFDSALDGLRAEGALARRRVAAFARLPQPDDPYAWLATLRDGVMALLFSLIPLWGLLGLARHPRAWELALKVTAFAQPPLVVGSLLAALLMTVGAAFGLAIGLMALSGGALWSLSLAAGFLIRMGGMPPRQAILIVVIVILFDLMVLSTLAGIA
jgi:hypothetical protein